MKQEFTSALTSRNQIASLYKSKTINWEGVESIFDIGSGKYYNKMVDYLMREKNVTCFPYDPFNIDKEINDSSLNHVLANKVKIVTCANVLNVIKEQINRETIYELAKEVLQENGKVYFSIYEGDKTGNGKNTVLDSWQNNKRACGYIIEINKYFQNVEVKGNVIIAY